MDGVLRSQLEDEIELQDRLVMASEGWGESFSKDQKTHAAIIKVEARFARALRRLFKDFADSIEQYVSFSAYEEELRHHVTADVSVEIIVSDKLYSDVDTAFVTVAYAVIADGITVGAQAGEAIYTQNLGITSTDAVIQKLTTERVAWLVGKKVDKDGQLVDNPNAKYNITDKMREDINQTIKTGINLGQDRATLTQNLQAVIANPKRAAVIAQTETVNAYSQGHLEFGQQSGATGKEWQDVFANDVCAEYAGLGLVPMDYQFGGEIDGPAAHPSCRCSLRLAYSNEYTPS